MVDIISIGEDAIVLTVVIAVPPEHKMNPEPLINTVVNQLSLPLVTARFLRGVKASVKPLAVALEILQDK